MKPQIVITMESFFKKNYSIFLILFCVFLNLSAQNQQGLWSQISIENASKGKQLIRKTTPKKANFFQLNIGNLKTALRSEIKNNVTTKEIDAIVSFPNSEGQLEKYRIQESSILESDFQSKHPEIKTFIGQNINNPSSTITFSLTSRGLHAMM